MRTLTIGAVAVFAVLAAAYMLVKHEHAPCLHAHGLQTHAHGVAHAHPVLGDHPACEVH